MSVEPRQVYKCQHCGITVEVLSAGGGDLHCCGEAMTLMEEQTADPATNKHVPVLERVAGGVKVKVGNVDHPMLDAHWIQWIQVIAGERSYRQFLKPGDAPEAFFPVEDEQLQAREFCNLHGLWSA